MDLIDIGISHYNEIEIEIVLFWRKFQHWLHQSSSFVSDDLIWTKFSLLVCTKTLMQAVKKIWWL